MITIHAGHNPDGLVASGAAGYMKESVENRKIVNDIMSMAIDDIVDVTVNDGKSQNDILIKLCDRMNTSGAQYNVSVHLNAGGGNGVECWTYGANSTAEKMAEDICKNISYLGFKNRGVKHSKTLYILKHTTAPTIIIEVCFVDTETDFMQYNKVGHEKIATAIMQALGIEFREPDATYDDEHDPVNEQDSTSSDGLEYVQVGAYGNHDNAVAMCNKLIAAGFPAYIKK